MAYAGFGPVIQGVQLWGATRAGPVSMTAVLGAVYPIGLGLAVAAAGLQVLPQLMGGGAVGRLGVALVAAYGIVALVLLAVPAGRRILGEVWALRGVMAR
jgi:hypothetical protein